MILRIFLILLCVFAAPLGAQNLDEEFLAAREAFRVGNHKKLEQHAARLRGHVLEPYVAYWQMRPRLDDAAPDEVRALLARIEGPAGERLRADWLRSLGKRGQWEQFAAEIGQPYAEDAEVVCLDLQRRAAQREADVTKEIRALWFNGRESAEACQPLFQAQMRSGALGVNDVWARIRLALEAGQVGHAKRLADHLPQGEAPDPKALDAAMANPQAFLDRRAPHFKTRGARTATAFALQRLARTAPQQAATTWRGIQQQFPEAERGYVWGQLAMWAAQRHDPDALDWYARAGKLSDQEAAWKVRAALRAQQWTQVEAAIDAMSEQEARDSAWRYWKARAQRSRGAEAEARPLLAALSNEHSFYGLLALEDLGTAVGLPAQTYRPGNDEIRAAGEAPAIQRALAFFRMGLRFEAIREWLFAIRHLDDRKLIATAQYARRHELWDRVINTADRTRQTHDFELRYLAPFREQFSNYSKEQGLDEAWVLGLVRQESRFIVNARSSAGALGLMQLMPATARWVAKKSGIKNIRLDEVVDVDTNISLGTWYLRHVYDTLDSHAVLASAAYNAGPGRARAWRAGEEMDAAVYTESIPFNETRDYVKKVMANAVYYAHTLGQRMASLKERIGVIPARNRGS